MTTTVKVALISLFVAGLVNHFSWMHKFNHQEVRHKEAMTILRIQVDDLTAIVNGMTELHEMHTDNIRMLIGNVEDLMRDDT